MKRLALTLAIFATFTLGGVAQSLNFDFEDGTLQGWTVLDGDGDGHCWEPSIGGMGHNSNGMVMAYSKDYATGDSLAPNEYLVSPRLVLSEDWPVINFYACALDEIYPAEHFGVSISTTVNDDPLAFTLLSQWTIAAKDAGNRQGNWYNYTVDLSAYTGQEVYVAIRHHYCSGQSAICIDDIQIEGEIVGPQYSVWKPIRTSGILLGANSDGSLFAHHSWSGIARSQDEGETWQIVLGYETGYNYYFNENCFGVSPEGRVFVFEDNPYRAWFSDDNGDTWEHTSEIPLNGIEKAQGLYVSTNDIMVGWTDNNSVFWTVDGGATWGSTILNLDENHQVSDMIVKADGDVYAGVNSFGGEGSGIFHSTLSDMQNWTLAAFEGAAVQQMVLHPDGSIVAGTFWGEISGFQHEPGFYLIDAMRDEIAISDNGVTYCLDYYITPEEITFVLAYSGDYGEHLQDVGESFEIAASGGGRDGYLYKGYDNYLYLFVNGQYYKSVQNADEIISDTPTNVAHSLWKPLNLPGSLMGVNAQGDLFCRNVNVYPSTLVRSQDEGETWETVFDSSFGNLAIGKKGRMFLICDRIVNYSDDNGDTWQQTSPINEGTGYNWFNSMKMRSPSNDTLVGYSAPYLTWTLDGGVSWDSTRIAFMEDHQEISDLLVNENGDVYVSIWYYIGPNIGVYHSTLSDMHNWELVAFEDVGVKDMAFDPEGNVICGVYFGGDFSGYEHVPGFYAYWSKDVSIADNGIIYKTSFSDSGANAAVLAYSLDHGEHFYNTVGDLPLLEPAPGGDDGFLSKGQDNHLYFLGNNQYWKSIPNANDIPNVIAFPSEWYYEIQNENGSITYQYMYQAGDTVVGDEPSHILVKINTLYDKGLREDVTREYVFMRDGKVYWWNKTLEEFTVLYDFGAQEGDTWVTKVGTETLIMHVNSVETVEYEGKTYRMLHVSDADDYFSGDIVCGIGHLTSFFPERLMGNGDGLRVEGLRCYWIEDELVFKPGDEDCDAIYSEVHGVEEDGPSTGSGTFTVYPNPTNGVLTVHHSAFRIHHSEFQIANLMGQTVLAGNLTTETQQIDVSGLPQGMYFVTVGGETRKFVVK